jgi:hypothetical protein
MAEFQSQTLGTTGQVAVRTVIGAAALMILGMTIGHPFSAEFPPDSIGSAPIVYAVDRAQTAIFLQNRIRVVDSGLYEGRGLGYFDRAQRLFIADAWEGLFTCEMKLGAKTCTPERLPMFDICPDGGCEQVDHRGLLVDGDGRFLLSEAHEQRLLTVTADNKFDSTLGGPFAFNAVVDAAIDDTQPGQSTSILAIDSDRQITDSGDIKRSGRLLRVLAGETKILDSTLTAPRGIAVSPCRERVYVADTDDQTQKWIYYTKVGDGWQRTGVLWTASAHDYEHHQPALRSIAVAAAGRKDDKFVTPANPNGCAGEQVFAAGPEGLYVFDPDGTLLAKFVVSEPVSGLTWSESSRYDGSVRPEPRLYMTIGHRLCYLDVAVVGPSRERLSYRLPASANLPKSDLR